jgi:hypothetical protein
MTYLVRALSTIGHESYAIE